MSIWFTADHHFGHVNIIRPEYCNRPYSSVDEMDEDLVARWNSRVGAKDVVYHCGDMFFGPTRVACRTLRRLNGRIHLVIGNHDRWARRRLTSEEAPNLVWAKDLHYMRVQIGGQKQQIVLSHAPFLTWPGSHHGSWNLHGHTHGRLSVRGSKRYDVGVDPNDYAPVSLETVTEIMARRTCETAPYRDEE